MPTWIKYFLLTLKKVFFVSIVYSRTLKTLEGFIRQWDAIVLFVKSYLVVSRERRGMFAPIAAV
jgi:hypothetical protein